MRKMPEIVREVPGNTVHASPVVLPAGPEARERIGNAKRGLIIATIAGLFFAFIGPLGTNEAPLLRRLGYWMLVMETGALIGIGVSTGVHLWGKLRSKPVAEGALISALIAVPLSVVVLAANTLFFEVPLPTLIDLLSVAGVVFVVSALITTINYATAPSPPAVIVEIVAAPEQVASPPRFMERLPMRLRHARLIAIEAEDHYLRVHTDAGSELLLMRLADAVAELGDIAGARTHRSWWVARDGVVEVENRQGRMTLMLSGGVSAPVSRTAKAALSAQGWFG
jgi:DNA-binding LytR/AlgR family response regulator